MSKDPNSRMFFLYMVNAFQSSITSSLSAYVTSGFESHSLIPVINIVSSVMGAATYMPLAKVLNVWDRSIGFVVMAAFATLGLILSATCSDIATYCAAQVGLLLDKASEQRIDHFEGFLQHRVYWHNLLHRRNHSGHVKATRSRPCIRFHVFPVYHHRICWTSCI